MERRGDPQSCQECPPPIPEFQPPAWPPGPFSVVLIRGPRKGSTWRCGPSGPGWGAGQRSNSRSQRGPGMQSALTTELPLPMPSLFLLPPPLLSVSVLGAELSDKNGFSEPTGQNHLAIC